jgi:transcriptional regulator CtsR
MELKEFVSETIKQMSEGIIEANKNIVTGSTDRSGIQLNYLIPIKFDIAVTAVDESKGTGGAKLNVASMFTAAGELEKHNINTQYSRIQFELKVSFSGKSNISPL